MTNSPLLTSVFAQAAQRWHYISVTYDQVNTIFIYKLGPFVNIKCTFSVCRTCQILTGVSTAI